MKKVAALVTLIFLAVVSGVGYYHLKYVYGAPEAVSVRELQMTNEAYQTIMDSIVSDRTEYRYTVAINPSHGGSDYGVSAGDVREKDIVLSIAKKVRERNTRDDIRICLTREVDVNPTLAQRLDIVSASDSDMIIDVHIDNDTLSSASGFNAYYSDMFYDYHLTNEELAETVVRGMAMSAKNAIAGINNVSDEKYPFLTGTGKASIAVGCGYISNSDELMALQSDAYCDNIAAGILDGIYEACEKLDGYNK